jgi:hypothetical protein
LTYRPWGAAPWLLDKIGIETFSVFGCLSPELRSSKSLLGIQKYASSFDLVSILDISPLDEAEERVRLSATKALYLNSSAQPTAFYEAKLDATLDEMHSYLEEAILKGGNVIIDISSFPKRWFFYAVKRLIEDDRVANLVAIYTSGINYADTLSENSEPLRALPGFPSTSGTTEYDFAFVGIGYQALAVFPLFGEQQPRKIRMLFPFPPGPPGISKNWEFVERVNREVAVGGTLENHRDMISCERLSALDVSQAFDAMATISSQGTRSSLLAPYGPKPMSLAMCLFSTAAEQGKLLDVPVFYTQPTRYSLDYTGDAKFNNGEIDTNAYALKLNGVNLYRFSGSQTEIEITP